MKVAMGTVKSYDWIRGDWLIELDDRAEHVFINHKDWRWTALSEGKHLKFQMIHRPEGIYALPIQADNCGESGC